MILIHPRLYGVAKLHTLIIIGTPSGRQNELRLPTQRRRFVSSFLQFDFWGLIGRYLAGFGEAPGHGQKMGYRGDRGLGEDEGHD